MQSLGVTGFLNSTNSEVVITRQKSQHQTWPGITSIMIGTAISFVAYYITSILVDLFPLVNRKTLSQMAKFESG